MSVGDPIITADEIVAELRKVLPVQRINVRQVAGIPRAYLMTHDYLYGVPIFVYGEGYKGQYLRHATYERDGKRHWVIEYGRTVLYGMLKETQDIIPLIVLGIPTHFVFTYRPNEFERFLLEEVKLGSIDVPEERIINLNRVMSGKDPVLIIDKYDLLRVDEEEVDRIKELHDMIEQLQSALFEYERSVREYQTNIRILQTRIAKYQELIADYERRLAKLAAEVTAVQAELIRLRDEMVVRSVEQESCEEAMKRLRDIVDSINEVLKEVIASVSTMRVAAATQASEKSEGGGK